MATMADTGDAPHSSPPFDATALPIHKFKDEIIQTIRNQRVTLIEGKTGCGKSGMVPQYILDDCTSRHEPVQIIVTQPRRIACVTLAKTVARMRNSKIGEQVGYQIAGDVKVSSKCQLIYSTTGYLVESLIHNFTKCKGCTHIVLDEIHERDLDIDLVACVVRELMPNNKFKVILMSATLQENIFQEYFSMYSDQRNYGRPINVNMERFKVDLFHIEELPSLIRLDEEGKSRLLQVELIRRKLEADYFGGSDFDTYRTLCYEISVQVIEQLGKGGNTVLVFLPGVREIDEFLDTLFNHNFPNFQVSQIPLHSRMSRDEQEEAFAEIDESTCRVIAATNVAETSVTLPNVDIVIDLGLQKEIREDIGKKITRLVTRSCSMAASAQRAGRTGRVCPGKVIRLFCRTSVGISEMRYDVPHVSRVPLESLLLTSMFLVKETVPDLTPSTLLLRMIESPSLQQIEYALHNLSKIGAITSKSENSEVTAIGELARGLPINVEFSRIIFFGVQFGIPCDAITLSATLSIRSLIHTPQSSHFSSSVSYALAVKNSLSTALHFDGRTYSEPIMLRNIFKSWLAYLEEYCDQHSGEKLRYFEILAEFCRDKAIMLKTVRMLEDKILEICTALSRHLSAATEMGRMVLKFAYLISKLRSRTQGDNVDDIKGGRDNPKKESDELCHGEDQPNLEKLTDNLKTKLNIGDVTNYLTADDLLMKTVLLVSFNHNMVHGRSHAKISSMNSTINDRKIKFCNRALTEMATSAFDPKRSLLIESHKFLRPLLDGLCNCVTVEREDRLTSRIGLLMFSHESDEEFVLDQGGSKPCPKVGKNDATVHDAPIMVHVIKRLAYNDRSIRFRDDAKEGSNRLLCGEFCQPYTLRWKLLSRNITGYISRNSLVGNASEVRDDVDHLFAVISKYTGTKSIAFATFDNLTVLPPNNNGALAWLLLLCFHPGDHHLSVEVVGQFRTIVQLRIDEVPVASIAFIKSQLRFNILDKINVLRKQLSEVVLRKLEGWANDSGLVNCFKDLISELQDTPLNSPVNLTRGPSRWLDISVTCQRQDPFPPWTVSHED